MRVYRVSQFNSVNESSRQDWFSSRRDAESFVVSERRAIRKVAKERFEELAEEFDLTLAEQRERINNHLQTIVINIEKVEFKATKQGILDLLNIYAGSDIFLE